MKTKAHTTYKTSDGVRVPSVTTITGILDKPALIHWAWKLGMEQIDYKKFRDDKADIGTLAHYLIMCFLRQEAALTEEYSKEQIDQAENCLISFYSWYDGHKVEPIIVEQPLVSDILMYGGTPDLYAYVDSKPTLVDFKTGKAIYPEYFYQVAAYGNLIKEQGNIVDSFRILRIGRDEDEGFEERVKTDLSKEWELFLHCREIYELQKQIRKEK